MLQFKYGHAKQKPDCMPSVAITKKNVIQKNPSGFYCGMIVHHALLVCISVT